MKTFINDLRGMCIGLLLTMHPCLGFSTEKPSESSGASSAERIVNEDHYTFFQTTQFWVNLPCLGKHFPYPTYHLTIKDSSFFDKENFEDLKKTLIFPSLTTLTVNCESCDEEFLLKIFEFICTTKVPRLDLRKVQSLKMPKEIADKKLEWADSRPYFMHVTILIPEEDKIENFQYLTRFDQTNTKNLGYIAGDAWIHERVSLMPAL